MFNSVARQNSIQAHINYHHCMRFCTCLVKTRKESMKTTETMHLSRAPCVNLHMNQHTDVLSAMWTLCWSGLQQKTIYRGHMCTTNIQTTLHSTSQVMLVAWIESFSTYRGQSHNASLILPDWTQCLCLFLGNKSGAGNAKLHREPLHDIHWQTER